MVPCSKMDALGPLSSPQQTPQCWKNPRHFHWPGIVAEVKNFIQRGPQCQLTSSHKLAPAPLQPLPIIDVPFEWIVGMDLLGPLPKSARGHKYILVITDYVARYSSMEDDLQEHCSGAGAAVILSGDPKGAANRPRYPIHVLTNLWSADYKQTLKRILHKVVTEGGCFWDLLLPFVLFASREMVQASMGFTPFEILFGRQPWGILDVA